MKSFYGATREASYDALRYYCQAIEIVPDFIDAYSWSAIAYTKRRQSNWMVDIGQESREALRLGRRAIELGKNDALALCTGGSPSHTSVASWI